MALNALGDLEGAIGQFRAAIDAEPNYVAAHFNLGNLLDASGRPAEAVAVLEKTVRMQPQFAPAHFGLGHALATLGRQEEALPQFERAVGLDPKYGVAWLGLGNAHLALGDHQAAMRAFDQALRLAPDEPAARLNRALALLALGDYARGLPAYEWRLDTPGSTPAPPLPRWNGEPLPGRTLLVRAEQGFGDTLQFMRFVPYAAKLAGRLVLQVQPALLPLLAPAAQAARVELTSAADSATKADASHVRCLSLPLALGMTTLDAIPARTPYLVIPAAYRRKWRGSIGGQAKRKIGIAWSGRLQPGETRSIPLAMLDPLFALEGIDWIVLQPVLTARRTRRARRASAREVDSPAGRPPRRFRRYRRDRRPAGWRGVGGYVGRASGRRARQAALADAAARRRLALGHRRAVERVVSECAIVSPARARRVAGSDRRSGCSGAHGINTARFR